MKIGIIGGTGLVGRALAKYLGGKYEIVVFSRRNIVIPGSEVRQMKRPELAKLADLDVIVNLAGEPIAGVRWSKKTKKKIISSRIGFTTELVQELEKSEKKMLLLNASAIGYYGSWSAETRAFSEDDPGATDFLGKLCLDWENAALKAKNSGHKVNLLRTGIVLTREGGALPKMAFPVKTFLSAEIGSGRQIMSWIHITDLVRAIEFIIDKNASGAWNLTAPQAVDNREFTKILGKILKRPTIFPVPGIILKLLYSEGAGVLLTGQKVLPSRLQKEGFTFRFNSAEAALRDLLL